MFAPPSTPDLIRGPCSACEHYRGQDQRAAICTIGPLCAQPDRGCAHWTARVERTGMRLLVCGGRDFADRGAAFRALDRLQERRPIGLVIHGGAPGADALAGEWAQSRGIAVQVFEALWKSQGPSAGPLRNQRMLDIGRPDGVLALPGGRGTVDMCTRALMAGVKVWRPWG